jgi:hypothetical protein
MGNEPAAIGDIRLLLSAQAAYANVDREGYDSVECLHEPTRCLSRYPSNGPTFLDDHFLRPVRKGYVFALDRGKPMPDAPSASAMKSFAYVAVPVEVGRTGTRAFCGDATGAICATPGGMPAVLDGACVLAPEPGCAPLR